MRIITLTIASCLIAAFALAGCGEGNSADLNALSAANFEKIIVGVIGRKPSAEELAALRSTGGVDVPAQANMDQHNALIIAIRASKTPLTHEQIQNILGAPSREAPSQSKGPSGVASSSGARGEFRLVGCYWAATATNEPLGLPNEDGSLSAEPYRGFVKRDRAEIEAVKKSLALRLAKDANEFAAKHSGGCPPSKALVKLILLVYRDRLPEKIPTPNNEQVAKSIPGLLVYAEWRGEDQWRFYNVGYQHEMIAKAKKEKQAGQARILDFYSRNKLVDGVAYDKLKANPFNYEGKSILTKLRFMAMRTSSSGIFDNPHGHGDSPMLVTDLPKTLFSNSQTAILAVKVIGTTTIDQPSGKQTVPHLKYLDAIKCQRGDCSDVMGN